MGKITIVNKKNHIPSDAHDVYIGRGSEFGNPFTHLPKELTLAEYQVSSREEAIAKYEPYFRQQILDNPRLRKELADIIMRVLSGEDINLVCYCKPQACHGDIIKGIIEKAVHSLEFMLPEEELEKRRFSTWIMKLRPFTKRDKYGTMSLKDFIECVEDGGIMDDDGFISRVIIDGYVTNVYVNGWGGYSGDDPRPVGFDLEELKTIQGEVEIDWANK